MYTCVPGMWKVKSPIVMYFLIILYNSQIILFHILLPYLSVFCNYLILKKINVFQQNFSWFLVFHILYRKLMLPILLVPLFIFFSIEIQTSIKKCDLRFIQQQTFIDHIAKLTTLGNKWFILHFCCCCCHINAQLPISTNFSYR